MLVLVEICLTTAAGVSVCVISSKREHYG